jgi:hypothetical protein
MTALTRAAVTAKAAVISQGLQRGAALGCVDIEISGTSGLGNDSGIILRWPIKAGNRNQWSVDSKLWTMDNELLTVKNERLLFSSLSTGHSPLSTTKGEGTHVQSE